MNNLTIASCVLSLSLSCWVHSAPTEKTEQPEKPVPGHTFQHYLDNWHPGMDTRLAGRDLREGVVNELGVFEMFMLQHMQGKLREEYVHEFPNLSIDDDDELGYSPEDLLRRSAGINYEKTDQIDKAIDAFIREAWLMSSIAIHWLETAVIYHVEGWPVSDPRIIEFFRQYAAEGIPRGQHVYGRLLLHGLGVDQNVDEGNRLMKVSGIETKVRTR